MAGEFVKGWLRVLLGRCWFFAVMNMLYFGCMFVAVFWAQFQFPPIYEGTSVGVPDFLVGVNWPFLVVGIFLFNLALSSFLVVTLPGLAFFPLSAAFILYRAFLWGVLLSRLSTPQFLAVLPTLILEGEGYVIASVAGTVLGISWLKPDWIFEGETLSRWEAVKKALGGCLRMYVLVAVVLFAAAVVETATLIAF